MPPYFDPSTAPYLNPSVDRRVVFITGANTGIGWFTALHLYLHGYVIYMAGRTESKVHKAIEELKSEANKRVHQYTNEEQNSRSLGSLEYVYLDLLDLSTVEAAVASFRKKESELHILINNAGIMGVPYEETKDGYEIQYQVNFVSHFLLTLRMLPLMTKVASEGSIQPRIIELSSELHKVCRKYFHPSEKLNKSPKSLYGLYRYAAAKLAFIQVTKVLSKKYPSILCVSVHPGIILDTELLRHLRAMPIIGYLVSTLVYIFNPLIGVSVEQGSLSALKTAMDPKLNSTEDSGKYYFTGGVESTTSKLAQNEKDAITTWNWNLEQFNKRNINVEASRL